MLERKAGSLVDILPLERVMLNPPLSTDWASSNRPTLAIIQWQMADYLNANSNGNDNKITTAVGQVKPPQPTTAVAPSTLVRFQ